MHRAVHHPAPPLLIEARDLRRRFGETVALAACSLAIRPGEIHALVGENGSGKSTLIKILNGIVAAESGTLALDGAPARLTSPRAAQRAGIATVFQETLVLDEMSVRDNMILGLDGLVRRRAAPAREAAMVRAALAALGLDVLDIERPVGTLSLARRQLVGIARALLRPWRLLILDESTSALDIADRDRLFAALRRFRADGRSILFVSHRMDEIETLADQATVLRAGSSVASLPAGAFSTDILLELMSSREEAGAAEGHAPPRPRRSRGRKLLSLCGFALSAGKPQFDFDLHAGEIVGVAGLEGHGQVAFLECIAGLRPAPAGAVAVEQAPIRSHRDALRRGVTFLPRDRKTEGIFAPLSVTDNVTVSCLPRLARWGALAPSWLTTAALAMCERARVRMTGAHLPIAALSGGNQQKALLARLLATRPRVLVLNDPMRGVDLGAKRDLYDVLAGLAAEGIGILLLSTELVELCVLCDRVMVFHDHALAATLDRTELAERSLIAAMFGQPGPGVAAA
ncbi:MAG TPA: sugar ABC transporter ATP-binding protein [Acetobacteraceae bacterium]|nr:sugar ABC transporter ATP-binding protein [Acetobacteraceae bacterium]